MLRAAPVVQVDKTYGVEEECILQATGAENDLGGTYIVRLSAGPDEQYLRSGFFDCMHRKPECADGCTIRLAYFSNMMSQAKRHLGVRNPDKALSEGRRCH